MKIFTSYLFIALLTAICSAQPWRWEQYQGDYYNPTDFPSLDIDWGSPSLMDAAGDFNSDGRDEYVRSGLVALLDNDLTRLHWTVRQASFFADNVTGIWSGNLDEDTNEEIIVYGDTIHAYKATSFNPWVWEQQDQLLTGLMFPDSSIKAIFGDYDSDQLLDGIFLIGSLYSWDNYIQRWERNENGEWTFEENIQTPFPLSLFDGDFDSDRDQDFGTLWTAYDFYWYGITLFVNNSTGITIHSIGTDCGPVVGDFNGDGLTESIYRKQGYPGFHYATLYSDPDNNIYIENESVLNRMNGPIIGDLNTLNAHIPLGIENGMQENWPSFPEDVSHALYRTERGWKEGLPFYSLGRIESGNIADLDGDGLRDAFLLSRYTVWHRDFWVFRKNVGTSNMDSIVGWYAVNCFPNNQDTIFTSPQIGDITGDGRAELATLAGINHQSPHVMFYEMIGQISDTLFAYHSELSNGLSASFTKIRLTDIDHDGLAELFGYNGSWHAYFFRNGSWHEQNINLPAGTSSEIYFADANNDGNPDLFTDSQVWYNLSPSAVEAPQDILPQDFSLSVFPNPFNSSAKISFSLPQSGEVKITVYDILGKEKSCLVHSTLSAGEHFATFNGTEIASGIYFLRMEAGGNVQTKKMMLLK